MNDPSEVCPECGARDAYRKRFVTGGGWRSVYRCSNCGRRHAPSGNSGA